MKKLLFPLFILIMFAGCKKEEKETFKVTYTFASEAPAYCVSIWDGTELQDYYDTVYTSPFTKTILYEYSRTVRCKISNRGYKPSKLQIGIEYDGVTYGGSDSLYGSFDWQRFVGVK